MTETPEPTCHAWKIVSLDDLHDLYLDRTRRWTTHPGVLSDLALAWDGESALEEWQQGRCAVCGLSSGDLVLDHDHETDLIRGLLCRSCNGLEARCSTDYAFVLFRKYRERSPAIMLGIVERYSNVRPEFFRGS